MYCDFCTCTMCQNGCSDVIAYHGDDPTTRILGDYEVWHAQCEDGRWICDVCYHYDCCVDAGSDPCDGLCGQHKCEHRPKIISEWTFWVYDVGLNRESIDQSADQN